MRSSKGFRRALCAIFLAFGATTFASAEAAQTEAPRGVLLAPVPRLSLITIRPGKALYSSFGHTAIRVVDPASGRDRLYNYGLSARPFDLAFALNMLSGRMDFMVAAQRTEDVFEFYREVENRGIVEQVLDLDEGRTRALVATLERASRRENREYNYRYFTDNCTTRPAEILRAAVGDASPPFADRPDKTLRSSVYEVLADRPWLKLAIGILCGPSADAPIPDGPIFLPQDLMRWAAQASYEGASGRMPLVSGTETLYDPRPSGRPSGRASLPSPTLIAFAALLALALAATLVPERLARARRAFDATLFALVLALFAADLVFWLCAGYREAAWNATLLWANPLPLVAFLLGRKEGSRRASAVLFRVTLAAAALAAAIAGLGPQSVPAEAWLAAAAVSLRCAFPEGARKPWSRR